MSQAFADVFLSYEVWLIVLAAAAYGVFAGAVPGLTATMAVALFVPVTFWLDPTPALAAIVTMTACAIFAGDIPTTLLRIPGTPASAAYADDAYGFTLRGEPQKALGAALVNSVCGGLFGAVVLMLVGRQLARLATQFSVAEYFWLYLLGLSCAVLVSRDSPLRAMFALLIGLLLSTVGLSAVHTQSRFTFGQPELYQGINFIPAMIGLFGVSEVLRNLLSLEEVKQAAKERRPNSPAIARAAGVVATGLAPAAKMLLRRAGAALRSGGIGAVIGMLPGAGADIAAWVSLAASHRLRRPGSEKTAASLEGISDATAANSAALAGGWIPALVFGIPGDSVTAIVIGVLLMKNITPGPEIFEKQATLVYSIYLVFILANLMLVPVGLAAIKLGGYVTRVPRRVLLPVILVFCIVGSFAIGGSYFDVGVMLAMGLLGFLLERRSIPLGPVVLGIILGGPLEERFIQAMTAADGSLLGLFRRPAAAVLGAACILVWTAILAGAVRRR